MKLLFGPLAGFLISILASGQQLNLNQFGPKANDGKADILEFKTFIVYYGDTLNRRDDQGQKIGDWIEYEKICTQITNGITHWTDSTRAAYAINSRGRYNRGQKAGQWKYFNHRSEKAFKTEEHH